MKRMSEQQHPSNPHPHRPNTAPPLPTPGSRRTSLPSRTPRTGIGVSRWDDRVPVREPDAETAVRDDFAEGGGDRVACFWGCGVRLALLWLLLLLGVCSRGEGDLAQEGVGGGGGQFFELMGLGLADVRLEERYFSGGRVDGRRVHEVCTFCGMSYAPISLVHSCGFFGRVTNLDAILGACNRWSRRPRRWRLSGSSRGSSESRPGEPGYWRIRQLDSSPVCSQLPLRLGCTHGEREY
ncbi:hypothetical protein KC359_g244 [Hortaea werneckii]|nr:hypothetical protein KC359_g244 [Hortaea werneckii]